MNSSRKPLLSLLCVVLMLQTLCGPIAWAQAQQAAVPLESLATTPTALGTPSGRTAEAKPDLVSYGPNGQQVGAGDYSSFGLGVSSTSGAAFANALATVDPSTGAALISIPFNLVAARGSSQPSLALSYDSSGGDREAGVGWGLNLPSITRMSPSGLARPLYNDPAAGAPITDAEDRFFFNGKPLIPICTMTSSGCTGAGGYAVQTPVPPFVRSSPSSGAGGVWHYYGLQVEDGSSMRFFWSPDHRTWVIQTKTGHITELGAPLDGNYDTTNGIDYEHTGLVGIVVGGGPNNGGGSILAPFRWNVVRQYDANRLSSGAPANPVVYTWASSGKRNNLSDIYDTPPLTAWPALSSYAHHTHLDWMPYPFPKPQNTPTWRTTPQATLYGVDVTSVDSGGSTRGLVRRYHLAYGVNDNNHNILTAVHVPRAS